jgi:exonuclease SbcC
MAGVIEEIELEGFEGFKKATVTFSQGLNLITGRNGVGKSSILDAIFFALYGEVPDVEKRLLVSRLVNADRKVSVRIVFNSPITNQKVEVYRCGGVVAEGRGGFRTEKQWLKIDGVEVTVGSDSELRRRVSDLIGVGMKKFLNLVYVRQGELNRILRPNMDEMDHILGITALKELMVEFELLAKEYRYFEGKDVETSLKNIQELMIPQLTQQRLLAAQQFDRVKKEVDAIELVLATVKSTEFLQLISKIEERDNFLSQLMQEEAKIRFMLQKSEVETGEGLDLKISQLDLRPMEDEIGQLSSQLLALTDRRNALNVNLALVKSILQKYSIASLDALRTLSASFESRRGVLEGEKKQADAKFQAVETRLTEVQGAIASVEKELAEHYRLVAEGAVVCPTCKQAVSPELLERHIAAEKMKIVELKPLLDQLLSRKRELTEKLDQLKREIATVAQESLVIGDEISKASALLQGTTVSEIEQQVSSCNEQLKGLEQKHTSAVNLYAAAKTRLNEFVEAKKIIAETTTRVSEINMNLLKTLETITQLMHGIGLQFSADDKDLKIKVAEKLPLTPDEILVKQKVHDEKLSALLEAQYRLEETDKQIKTQQEEATVLTDRLKQAQTSELLMNRLAIAIENIRKNTLQHIAHQALTFFNDLTDQNIYTAFEIRPENYHVYVFPENLHTKIPATRTGGGHQTLIALSLRLAILQVLGFRHLLILDEPTYGVDAANTTQLLTRLTEAAQSITQMILVTHYGLGEEAAASIIRVEKQADGTSAIKT